MPSDGSDVVPGILPGSVGSYRNRTYRSCGTCKSYEIKTFGYRLQPPRMQGRTVVITAPCLKAFDHPRSGRQEIQAGMKVA